jgi:hypothetical protein
MSKVLVDRVELEEAAKWLEAHSSSSGSAEAFAADALREAIAQPAEAEGVEVVAYATPNEDGDWQMLFFDEKEAFLYVDDERPAPLIPQSGHLAALSAVTAERDRLESMLIRTATRHFALQIKDRTDDKKLDECLSEGIAMLEAERDQYREMAACMELLRRDMIEAGVVGESCPPMFMTEGVLAHIAKLRAEVEALRVDAERFRHIELDCDSGMRGIYGDDWVEVIDSYIAEHAAMAAKEA